MSPLDAHKRLMDSLPVRTHLMANDDPKSPQRRSPEETAELKRKVLDLRAKGWTIIAIADELQISKATVFGWIRASRGRRVVRR